jgi:hypothetical protein
LGGVLDECMKNVNVWMIHLSAVDEERLKEGWRRDGDKE